MLVCARLLWVYIKCMSKKLILKIESTTIYIYIFFDNLNKAKKLETKYLIDKKNYNDLVIYFYRYVHSKLKKMLSLHYHELMGKIDDHEEKIYLMIDD